MSFEESVLTLMRQKGYVPQTAEELADTFQLDKKNKRKFNQTLKKLLEEGAVARVKKNRYIIPKDADLVTGVLKFRQSGSAVLIPEETSTNPTSEPIQIRAEDTSTAFHGDLVIARLLRAKDRKNFYHKGKRVQRFDKNEKYGRVIRILKPGYSSITGTLQKDSMYYYVVPDDPRFHKDFIVEDPIRSTLKPRPKVHEKVIIADLTWKHRHMNPTARITAVLGMSHTPKVEFEAVLHKYNLDANFPDGVQREVAKLPDHVRAKDIKGRLDCRKHFTLTIDPDDAKDFDDALSIEHLKGDETRIGIHIADVSAYVKTKTQLDREAQKRGNSTYLVGCVIPMLPHELSSGLCSLKEGVDRLTKSVFLTFSKGGKLKKTEFANTVIHSDKRLTYKQAYNFLFEDDLDLVKKTPMPPAHQTGFSGRPLKDLSNQELSDIQKTIRTFWHIASKMRQRRMTQGSLDLEMPEVKIFVDPEGYPDRIERIHNDESHQLIEEFMLAANEAVAKAFHKAKIPFISRVHDKPDDEKLQELGETLVSFGLATGDLTHKPEVTKLLSKLKTHPQGHTMKIQFLRSLKQACYRAEADGHYGLHKVYYTHFTSPIRRYSDLVVHRVLDMYMSKQGLKTAPQKINSEYTKPKQESIARHLSLTEQNSTEAERESVKIKLIEYFEIENAKKDKAPFEAIITDLRNHGMFIELTDSMAFGFIHISTLQDDLYTLNDQGNAFVGRRKKRRFEIGQTIQVMVDRVDRFKRQIDFRLNENYSSKKIWGQTKPPFESSKKQNQKKTQRKTSKKRAPKKKRNT